MKRILSAWWLPLLYMGGIFALSAQSRLPEPPGPWVLSWDKAQHFAAYFLMGLLVFRAAGRIPVWKGMPIPVQTVLVGVLYGALDEIHQYFVPGRDANPLDLTADMAGLILAAAVAALFKYIQTSRRKKDVGESGRESVRSKG